MSLNENSSAVLITGPTASGKSALALDVARAVNGVIINTDSMQVYDTLQLLTARPSDADMEGIPHHLYGHVSAGSLYSTGAWLRDVAALMAELKATGKKPVFVGGTGLYFRALTEGLAEMPAIPAEVRAHFRALLAEEGPEALHQQLCQRDAAVAARLQPADGQRIVRALEVLAASGRSIAEFQAETPPPIIPSQAADKFVVLPERALLHQRINVRFEKMMEAGAINEVKALLAMNLDPALPAMRAIGVSEISALLRGEISRNEAIERASAATRQYAKRQMTWFRNQMDDAWQRVEPELMKDGLNGNDQ